MKKYGFLVIAVLLFSCKSQHEAALKSADKDFILKTANEEFAKKKWKDALALYDRTANLIAGTDAYPNVLFNQAYANYHDKNYRVAGSQFKSFSVNFPKDARAEEAAYMAALCYYNGSMEYNLDQSTNDLAINELQNFLNQYPTSERSKNISTLIDELGYKQEQKAYENARQYYKIGEYKAANTAFENVLNDFPGSKLKPEIINYIMLSRYELAMNSIYDLKADRLANAVAYSKEVEKTLPNSDFARNAASMREKLQAEQIKFAEVVKETEARKAEIAAKQNESVAKLDKREKEKEQAAEMRKEQIKTQQALKDSAAISTPPPAATFKIQR